MHRSNPSKVRRSLICAAVAGSLLAMILAVGIIQSRRSSSSPVSAGKQAPQNSPRTNGLVHSQSAHDSPKRNSHLPAVGQSASAEAAELASAIQTTLEELRAQASVESSRRSLQSLRERLVSSRSPANATSAIRGFLNSGQDVQTGLGFRLGPKHSLLEAPTLRTALLDWFGEIDGTAAAEFTGIIFKSMSSPEEYAIALRNFAQGRPEARDELRDHFNRLLTHQPWADQPSAGYLESFDLVPYLKDPAFLKPLSDFLQSSAHRSVQHASLIALDRLVLANPSGVLQELINSSQCLAEQPLARASFFARADLRDPLQRRLVERYLLLPSLLDLELDKFVGLFPNANGFASYNLLTESIRPRLAELAAQDAATLERLTMWKTDVRFARLESRLTQLQERVREHVESATQAGYLPKH
jgi:hypothetical protein